jgi:hypothetical protein
LVSIPAKLNGYKESAAAVQLLSVSGFVFLYLAPGFQRGIHADCVYGRASVATGGYDFVGFNHYIGVVYIVNASRAKLSGWVWFAHVSILIIKAP